MLQLLLTTLKILGIIILVLLGIILAALLIVLLVPIRYRGDVSFDGEPRGGVLVSWMLRFVTVRLDYDGSALRALVQVLWFRLFDQALWPSDAAEQLPEELPEELSNALDEAESFADVTLTDLVDEAPAEAKVPTQEKTVEFKVPKYVESVKESLQDPMKKTETSSQQTKASEEKKRPFLEVFVERLRTTVINLIDKAAAFYKSLAGTYAAGQEKIASVQVFLGNTENQETIRLILRQVMKIVKHILPGKLRGRVKFGFDDPATTGQILTYISPFYGVYAKTVTLEPIFDEKVMEGELHLRGRIRLGTLLLNVVRVFLNKNFRTLLKTFMKKSK